MLYEIEVGQAGSSGLLARYLVVAKSIETAMEIARAKAMEENPDEEGWYDVIEATIKSGVDPLTLEDVTREQIEALR